MALKLDILANTTSLIQSMKKGGASIEDVSDALDDLAREGADAGEKMERSFRDIAREASDSGGKVGREMKDGFKKAGDGAEDFKQEANSTAREAAASFDGSAESIGDAFQEVAANAFAGFGPAGALAGLAAAAGIGLATEAFNKAKEATEEAKEAAYDYAFAVTDTGAVVATAEALRGYTSDVEKMKEAQEIATASGWELRDVVLALATGEGLPALTKAFDENSMASGINGYRLLELDGTLRGTAQGLKLGTAGAELYSGMLYTLATQAGVATGEVDELGNQIYELPDGKQIVVNAETKQASNNLDAFEGEMDAIAGKEVTSTVKLRLDTSAYDNWTPRQKVAWVDVQGGISRNGRQLIT